MRKSERHAPSARQERGNNRTVHRRARRKASLAFPAQSGARWWNTLPVPTTHVLSSDMAGTMAANGSGAQISTVRSLALTWVLTLPCAIALSACLTFVFRHLF
jgi:phosphate/sulfate permease